MVGVPQPSLAIGPIRKRPSIGGKMRLRSPMMRGALATTSRGKRTLLSEPSRTPARNGSKRIVQVESDQAADSDQREAEAETGSV